MSRLSCLARRWLALVIGVVALSACEDAYPEVIVVNRTAESVLLRDPSFNGCLWNVVLAYGEATAPGRCLPGRDRVHFQRLDAAAYCREQAQDETIDGVCACGEGSEPPEGVAGVDPNLVNLEPTWFPYQTVARHHAGYGDFVVLEITLEGLEQDFSAPGPYGH